MELGGAKGGTPLIHIRENAQIKIESTPKYSVEVSERGEILEGVHCLAHEGPSCLARRLPPLTPDLTPNRRWFRLRMDDVRPSLAQIYRLHRACGAEMRRNPVAS